MAKDGQGCIRILETDRDDVDHHAVLEIKNEITENLPDKEFKWTGEHSERHLLITRTPKKDNQRY